MKYLVSNGCSFTEGVGLVPVRSHRKGDVDFGEKVKSYRYSGILSKKLGIEDINLSRGGAPNDRIFGTTIDWIVENIEKCNDTLFVIQWSYIGRELHEKLQEKYNFDKFDWEELRKRDMRFVYSLQNIFKFNNWKYVFFEGHSFEDDEKSINLDWDTHIGLLIDKNYLITPGFLDFAGEKILPDLHPNKEAHVGWTNKLYDFIKDKRWL